MNNVLTLDWEVRWEMTESFVVHKPAKLYPPVFNFKIIFSFSGGCSQDWKNLLLLRGGHYKLLFHDLPVHSFEIVTVSLCDQLLLVLHLPISDVEEAVVREAPWSQSKQVLFSSGCGLDHLVWQSYLPLHLGHVSQILLTHHFGVQKGWADVPGKQAKAESLIWLTGIPASKAATMSTSLFSCFSALSTACLFRGTHSLSQG